MTKKRDNLVDNELEGQDLKLEKGQVLLAVRQYFYKNEQYNENLIKTLERSYFDNKKSEEDWDKIMIVKKIIFK